ncbi:MAG: hypothetical protein Q8R16_00185, partial [bacterium]|nr:hypothetical protein [bacterium]
MDSRDLLQSEGWERFQAALGRKTVRVDGVLAIEMPLPFGGTYSYSPRASFSRKGSATASVFWRAESSDEGVTPRVLRRAVEPEWTWRTSLVGTDEERLVVMHEKHRYNMRLATKRGVVVRVTSSS